MLSLRGVMSYSVFTVFRANFRIDCLACVCNSYSKAISLWNNLWGKNSLKIPLTRDTDCDFRLKYNLVEKIEGLSEGIRVPSKLCDEAAGGKLSWWLDHTRTQVMPLTIPVKQGIAGSKDWTSVILRFFGECGCNDNRMLKYSHKMRVCQSET